MSGKFLLYTNIVIALFAEDAPVLERLAQAEAIFIASITLGELYYGAHKSARVTATITRIDEFAASNVVLACELETARYYGNIKNALKAKGRPIPENDIWIAAIAQQHNLVLVSRDEHFQVIDGLRVEKW